MNKPIIDYVLEQLEKRRGSYVQIAKEMEPDNWEGYYSWLTKVATGRIPDPGVRRIQALADHFRAEKKRATA